MYGVRKLCTSLDAVIHRPTAQDCLLLMISAVSVSPRVLRRTSTSDCLLRVGQSSHLIVIHRSLLSERIILSVLYLSDHALYQPQISGWKPRRSNEISICVTLQNPASCSTPTPAIPTLPLPTITRRALAPCHCSRPAVVEL